MEGYYSILNKIGATAMIHYEDYEPPTFLNEDAVFAALDDIRQNRRRVLMPGDPDVDGLSCLMVLKDAFEAMGYSDYDFFPYEEKNHGVNPNCIWRAIQQKYDYVIITDSGCNSLVELQQLLTYGIKVIILDHHRAQQDYRVYDEMGISCINTQIDNAVLGEVRYALSAAALCFCVMEKYLRRIGKKVPASLSVYALISLYSDCMDMSNRLNKQIYYLANGRPKGEMPDMVQYFMTVHTRLSRRFIEYWYAPRINALFRADAVKYINYYFLEKQRNADVIAACLQNIEVVYTTCRDVISKVADLLSDAPPTEWENVAVVDLKAISPFYDVKANRLYNYTGLIANKLSEKWGKAVVVCWEMADGYKGSVRDQRGRDYLSSFKRICNAGGHASAFGFQVPKFEYQNFLQALHHVDKYYTQDSAPNAPIVIEYDNDLPDERLLGQIARYNDFCGERVPYIYLLKTMQGSITPVYSSYDYQYRWGDSLSISSKRNLLLGEKLYLKPYVSNSLKLEVQ